MIHHKQRYRLELPSHHASAAEAVVAVDLVAPGHHVPGIPLQLSENDTMVLTFHSD